MVNNNNNETNIEDVVKILDDVCKLTSDKCEGAINRYIQHGNALILVADVFTEIDKCDTPKCEINKDAILSKLNEFLRSRDIG